MSLDIRDNGEDVETKGSGRSHSSESRMIGLNFSLHELLGRFEQV